MPRTIVAGGGIAGLTAGHALRAAGHDVLVCESHPSVRGSGAILGIWPPHMELFEQYGLAEEIAANALNDDEVNLWDAAGRPLRGPSFAEVCEPYRLPYSTIYRPLLNRIIAEPLGDAVRTGAAVAGYVEHADRVEVRFADGGSEDADVLVGADGVGSQVRAQLWPQAQLVDTAQVAWRGVVAPHGVTLPERHGFAIGRAATRGGWLRVADGQAFWVVARFGVSGSAPADVKAEVLAQVEHVDDDGWGFPLRALIEATPAPAIHRDAVASVPPLPTWVTERVVLIGDAAHALSPHISSGAAYAIEDAHVLGRTLAEAGDDVAAGLAAFDVERRARLAWVREASARVSDLVRARASNYGAAWVEFVRESLATTPRASAEAPRRPRP